MLAADPIYLDPGIIQVYFAFVVAMLVMAPTMVVAGRIYAWTERKSPRRIMSQSAFRALLSQDKDNLTLSARAARPIGQDLHCKANARGSPVNGNSSDAPTINARRRLDREHPGKKKAIRTKYTNFARQEFTKSFLGWAFIAAPAA